MATRRRGETPPPKLAYGIATAGNINDIGSDMVSATTMTVTIANVEVKVNVNTTASANSRQPVCRSGSVSTVRGKRNESKNVSLRINGDMILLGKKARGSPLQCMPVQGRLLQRGHAVPT